MALSSTQVSPQGQSAPSGPTSGIVDKSAGLSTSASYSGGGSSSLIMIIGKSGRGKSTALRNLPPEETFIISVIGKPLPFPAAKKFADLGHLVVQSNPDSIRRLMKQVNDTSPAITNLVIDDGQYIMATEFMDKALVKGYDKFTVMARNIWEILVLATKLRPNLKIFFLTHEEDTGTERKMKTLGKLLDDKITPEGLSTIVLFSDVTGDKDNRLYYFSTQSDGVTNAKSPFEMFPPRIPNDLNLVAKRIDEYYEGTPLASSTLKPALEI